MRRNRLGIALALALGCNITTSLGSGESSTGTSDEPPLQTTTGVEPLGTSSGMGGMEGTNGLGTTAGSSSGDSSLGDTTGSTGSGWATTGGPSTGFDDEDVCASPFDDSCLACLQESCCEALVECIDNPNCACLVGCLEFAPDFLSCIGAPACQGGPQTQLLTGCAAFECTQACGFPGPPDGDAGFFDEF